jgi:hypothetical protein
VLFALLAAARKLSNSELEAQIGLRLDGRERRRLNELKLVDSERPGREFTHELSDAGWRWCAEEFTVGLTGRSTILERALYQVLARFEQCMTAEKLSLADVMTLRAKTTPKGRHKRRDTADGNGNGRLAGSTVIGSTVIGSTVAGGDLDVRVTLAYQELAEFAGDMVSLRDLREHLADVPRPALDSALATMFTAQRVNLIPQSNQQALTAVDREAALRLGGEHKHLICIE